jgi:hypothetical protein
MFDEMNVSEDKRLKALESENAKLNCSVENDDVDGATLQHRSAIVWLR